jgi:glycosyltransferase involved in cell wall biosynthesis
LNKKIFILVPAIIPTGPIKGAIALANALAEQREITLVSLKSGESAHTPIDSRINLINLSELHVGFLNRIKAYKKLLKSAGGRQCLVSISMCFSADLVNLFCKNFAVTCSSVRGNLPSNYRMDYGWPGLGLAFLHLFMLRLFDHVTVMTESMAQQVSLFLGHAPYIAGNFVDEMALEQFRMERSWDGPPRFVFLGSLSKRKCPGLVIKAIKAFHDKGVMATLDVVGSGPMMRSVCKMVEDFDLEHSVTFHGQLSNPYPLVSKADAMVLPSLSEGVSRAALEALLLGTPCVLRKVDGNASLIQPGKNGALFTDDSELVDAMEFAATFSRRSRGSLIPDGFRQCDESLRLLRFIEDQK